MSASNLPAIQLENIAVKYHLLIDRTNSLKDYVISLILRRQRHRDFWAIKNFSAEVHKGECLGIIGKNAASVVIVDPITG